jgi:hypothetical protein
MKKLIAKKLIACALLFFAATPAFASLKVGDKAPDFTAPPPWAARNSPSIWPMP